MIFFYIPLDDSMKGIYEMYADLAVEVVIEHPDRDEMEGEILMEVSHGYGDMWKAHQTPSAHRVGCACGNARSGTE